MIPVDFKQIPIYITSFNRLSSLKQQIDYFKQHGYTNLFIVDNNSSYPPLLEYLKSLKHQVYFLEKNYGHKVFWECGKFADIIENEYYVVTDPDIIPVEDCPDNFVEIFYDVLQAHPEVSKVGFALKIDDLPSHFDMKNTVIEWESRLWNNELQHKDLKIYQAPLDTTFALYKPKIDDALFLEGIRTGAPYCARHLPWYADSSTPTEEDLFYIRHSKNCTTWSGAFSEDELREKHGLTTCKTKYKLFNKLTVFSIKQCGQKTVYKVLGLPIWKVRKNIEKGITKYYIMNILVKVAKQ